MELPSLPARADLRGADVGAVRGSSANALVVQHAAEARVRGQRRSHPETGSRTGRFFGAPHVAIITTDRDQGVYGAVDCGGYVSNLVNAASSLSIATIPQAAIAMFSDRVRESSTSPKDG